MRKTGLFTLLLFISLNISFGQKIYKEYIAGLNIATLAGDSSQLDNRHARLGAYVGLGLNFKLSYSSFVQVGAIYSQQGTYYTTEEFRQGYLNIDYTYHNIDYLHIPFLWREYFGNFYSELGGYVAIALFTSSPWKKEIYYTDSIYIAGEGEYISFSNNLTFYDYGALFGIGYETMLTPQYDVGVTLRFKPGLAKINTGGDRPSTILRNQVFTISVSIVDKGRQARYLRAKGRHRKRR